MIFHHNTFFNASLNHLNNKTQLGFQVWTGIKPQDDVNEREYTLVQMGTHGNNGPGVADKIGETQQNALQALGKFYLLAHMPPKSSRWVQLPKK